MDKEDAVKAVKAERKRNCLDRALSLYGHGKYVAGVNNEQSKTKDVIKVADEFYEYLYGGDVR